MATEQDKTNTGVIATIVAVGGFSMIAVSAFLTAMVREEVDELSSAKGAYADLNTVRELKSEQREQLGAGPRWVDKAKGTVAIPLDQAMEAVTQEVARNPNRATPALPIEPAAADGGVEGAADGAAQTGSLEPNESSRETRAGAGGTPGVQESTADQAAKNKALPTKDSESKAADPKAPEKAEKPAEKTAAPAPGVQGSKEPSAPAPSPVKAPEQEAKQPEKVDNPPASGKPGPGGEKPPGDPPG